MFKKKTTARGRRKRRIRKKMSGSADRPRLSVFRSAKHIYAQVVNDSEGRTLANASTLIGEAKGHSGSKLEAAQVVGKAIAAACKSQGIEKVVFDRNGFLYHGRIRALADAAREAGLNF